MSRDPIELARIQRWMQSVITHPDGIEAAIASEQARSEIDVDPQDVESVITRSRALTSIERLQVYGNAYYARLLECLREEFPALVHAVGEETFSGFAFGYLQQYPSTSYTLANLGREFPRYLSETRPATAKPDGEPDWADFLIDLARLERTYAEVFDGPGGEDGQLLQPGDLAGISPERWTQARLVPVESLRLLELSFPVHEYATAVRKQDEQPAVPQPSPTYLVVGRRNYIVRRQAVTLPEFTVLQAIAAGRRVEEAIEALANALPDDANLEFLASDLQRWFRNWAAAGYFRQVELDDDAPF